MRNYQRLEKVSIDANSGVLTLMSEQDSSGSPRLAMRREGSYVSISASYGPLEIALRPRFVELGRTLARLQPVRGLQTTRQVGTGQAYLALGLMDDGSLVLLLTIVADATGHLSINMILTSEVRQTIFDWLPISEAENTPDA